MDFIEFLNFSNRKDNNKDKEDNDKQITNNIMKKEDKRKYKKFSNTKDLVKDGSNYVKKNKRGEFEDQEKMILYNNLKRGDYIKIIYKEGSIYNYYKGYIGEVKEYDKSSDFAIICLLTLSAFKLIKLPLTHFIKMENVC